MLTTDQLVRILIIVLPILITVLGDGRYTRNRLDDFLQRLIRLEDKVDDHIRDQHPPTRRR